MPTIRNDLDVDKLIGDIDTATLAKELPDRRYPPDSLSNAIAAGDMPLIREILFPRRTPDEWRAAYETHMAEQRARA